MSLQKLIAPLCYLYPSLSGAEQAVDSEIIKDEIQQPEMALIKQGVDLYLNSSYSGGKLGLPPLS